MKVIRDLLPELYVNKIHDMMSGIKFNWHFLSDVTYAHEGPHHRGSPGFAHLFFDEEEGIESECLDFVYPALLQFAPKDHKLIRIKGGLLLQTSSGYNRPHVDFDIPHTTALYYVNDSDGDTVFFDRNGSITDRVRPEKNKLIIFDGLKMHASSCPTLATNRIVINFNYVCPD